MTRLDKRTAVGSLPAPFDDRSSGSGSFFCWNLFTKAPLFFGINGQIAAHTLNCGRKPGDGEERRPASSKREGGGSMWVKPAFEVIEVCAEVTAYAYQK
ncbi:hypothetical protein J19TS2_33130 [Cohnella xylanilytica]|uniref:Coenzyme PQQ synthesis protein A n=1 Tax=Cohnella xylanilytica TaxID=557555 RepID=A0A841TXM5_9BACL|nr:pyrroloquinoline quinone precursor peptide PqqA [Cohnella xylanilytica]GIO13758.1 hypothetical protein J19TS2_33130 [Cohnella xylanilytica]